MKTTILVTGGTGYIGSHTAVELIENGYDVIIVDNLSNSSVDTLDGIEQITGIRPGFEQLDVDDMRQMDSFLKGHPGIAAIAHFAAYKSVGESVRYPIKYYSNNLNGTLSILNGMRIHRIPNILFSSSCTVYGQPDQLPVDESAPIKKAESPYGNTKRISEEMIKDYVDSHDDSFAISLRYFNPIGAHPTAIIGENPMGIPDNLVPYITQTAIGKHKELKVFGDDYDTPDGTAIRDYLHVVDLAKAHVIAIQRLLNKETSSKFDIFNLGTGRGTSVLEMIQAFTRVSGINLNYRIVKRRPGDVERVWADTSHANQVLGWKALSSIDDAMLTAWNWEKRLSKLSN